MCKINTEMEKHTKCRLEVIQRAPGQYELAGDGTCIEVAVIEWIEKHDEGAAANARRLDACWNACEGIQTQTLEVLPAGKIAALKTERDGAILDKMAVMMEREDRRAENDRLRKLLSTAVHFAEHPEVQWVVDARAALNPAPEAAE